MKIVICGSVNFAQEMRRLKGQLVEMGHEVVLPYSLEKHNLNSYDDAQRMKESDGYVVNEKPDMTRRHMDEIKNSDAVLIVNMEKRGIPDYIGGATLAEIMFAFYLNKKIFLLNPIPTDERILFYEEIAAVKPIVLNGNLGLVK